MKRYLFLLLFTTVLSKYIQAQTQPDSLSFKRKEVLEKVKAKFKKDKEPLREFKYLGLCHCISEVLESDNSLFIIQYSSYFNSFSALTRLMKENVLKNTFIEYERRLKNFTKKNDNIQLDECYALYKSRVAKRFYRQMIANSSNYVDDEFNFPFMYDYLKCGYADFRRFVEGPWDFEKGEISWQNVYYYFNKWSKDGSFQRIWLNLLSKKKICNHK